MRSRWLQFEDGEVVDTPWLSREAAIELAMLEPYPGPSRGGRIAWAFAFAAIALWPFGVQFFLGR